MRATTAAAVRSKVLLLSNARRRFSAVRRGPDRSFCRREFSEIASTAAGRTPTNFPGSHGRDFVIIDVKSALYAVVVGAIWTHVCVCVCVWHAFYYGVCRFDGKKKPPSKKKKRSDDEENYRPGPGVHGVVGDRARRRRQQLVRATTTTTMTRRRRRLERYARTTSNASDFTKGVNDDDDGGARAKSASPALTTASRR